MKNPTKTEITEENGKILVRLGTYHVNIYTLREAGRPDRFRLKWSIGGKTPQTRNVKTREEALEQAGEILDFRCAARDDLTEVSTKKLRYWQLCEESLGGVPLDVACKFYLAQCPTAFVPAPVSEIVDDVLASLGAKKGGRGASPEWVRTVKRRGKAFAEFAAGRAFHEITTVDVAKFLRNPEWNLRTQFNYQGVVALLYGAAKKANALPKTDSAFDKFDKIEKPMSAEKDVLPPSSLEKVLRAAVASGRTRIIPYLAVCAFGGVRAAEANRLVWGTHVDMEERVVRLTTDITKTGCRRIVQMNDAMFAWLSKYQGADGTPIQTYEDAGRVVTVLWKEAGLTEWPHNALRVSFISYSMALTENAAAVANGAGHSEQMLQTVYKQIRGVNKKTAKEWFDILPDLHEESLIPQINPTTTTISDPSVT